MNTQNPLSADPIHLHIQAMNSLARCTATLLANEPVYLIALQNLAVAQRAVAALATLETDTAH